MNLKHHEPTREEALEYLKNSDHISGFACKYPGRYQQAADLLMKIRKEINS